MTTFLATDRHGASRRGVLANVVGMLLAWQQQHRARANLARLDDHMLRDIGLTPADAQYESSKPFWRD